VSKRAALVIFAVAFTLRLIHIWQIRRSPFFTVLMGDARGYDEWAQRIAGGDWIGRDVFYQAPLYPYFLGSIYWLVGRSLMIARLVQAAIGSCSCVLVAAAASRLFSARAGLVAGLMLAIYAPAIFFEGLLQKSVLDVFFVCLALWLIAVITTPSSKSWSWLALGLALGALSLTRENAVVLIVVILGWAILRFGVRSSAVLLLGVAVVLVPVAVRNSIVGGGFYVTTSQFGPNFFVGNHPGADGTYQSLRYGRGSPEFEQRDASELAENALHRKLTPREVSGFWTSRALAFIASEPGAWLKLMARKVALLSNATEMVDTEDQETYAEWSVVLSFLGPVTHFGILVPLAVAGMFATWSSRSRLGILYALPVAYSGSVVIFYVFGRYRYPLVPMLVLFAAPAAVVVATSFLARYRVPASRRRTGFSVLRPGLKTLVLQMVCIVGVAIFANWPIESVSAMRAVTETNLGTALHTEHRLDDAIEHYRRALAAQPDYAPAYSNLAVALREQNRIDEAVASYEQALKIQPEFATAHYNFANLLLERGDPVAAIDHFERAIRKEPASADAHGNLGMAFALTGRIDEALREFRAAIDLDPASAKAYRNLGDVLSSQNHWPEAISALHRAVDLDPSDPSVRYDLASTLLESGRLDEAISEFRATLRLAPTMADAHNNLGIALGSKGKLDEAVEEFRRALAIQPGFAGAQQNLTMALAARGARQN
jgi:tetratricopeptide (TPR) repeat protein/4-amino-4-deoxy-L-arabinose transferase-like glycosyltransferase